MKKKLFIIKRLVLIQIFAIFIFSIISCTGKVEGYTESDSNGNLLNDNPAAIAIIFGRHANAMAIPDDVYKSIESTLDNAVYGGYVCAIIADSTPTKVNLIGDQQFFAQTAKNEVILREEISSRIDELSSKLRDTTVRADSEEVDLLAAIREAKNALSSTHVKDISDKKIIIVDSGISTCGELNFLDLDFIYGKPEISEIIAQLQSYEGLGVLPDLTEIEVIFIGTEEGLAEVAEPQKATTTDKKFIKNLWIEVVNACGAQKVQFESAAGWSDPNKYTEDSDSQFPYVSVVTFFHEKVVQMSEVVDYDSNNPDDSSGMPAPPNIEVELTSETIGFKPDTSEYQNEENTKKILGPYADELKVFFEYYEDEKIWIVGTTATIQMNGEGSVDLSLDRAEAVKKTLVNDFGVPSDRLLTIGLGARFPWHINEFVNGDFNTEVAQQNRAVWLVTAHSDTEKYTQLKSAVESYELLPEVIERYNSLN